MMSRLRESRIRRETLTARKISLHDLGCDLDDFIRSHRQWTVGEVITRTWLTAHKMKVQRGSLGSDPARLRQYGIKRYIAKYTINPALAHGISHEVGSS